MCCWAFLLLTALCAGMWSPGAWAQTAGQPLRSASGIAFDAQGNLYIADAAAHRVWEATLGGALVLVAGNGTQGFAGDGGPGTSAQLNQPLGLAFGADGTLYIADTGNQRIRVLKPTGTIATFAGNGVAGYGGDGGPALSARLREPSAVAVDASGALLICDTGNHRLRRVAAGFITTVAGTGVEGFGGDGGPALAAELDSPSGVAVGADGRTFIADTHNHRVRVLSPDGTLTAFAGTGAPGFAGDGGAAAAASLSLPRSVAVTLEGDVLIADEGNQRVRKVSTSGLISTIAGSGVEGASQDAATALEAPVRAPRSVAVSSFGVPVFADTLNRTVREAADGVVLYQPAALVPGRFSAVTAQISPTLVYGQSGLAAISVAGQAGAPKGEVQLAEGGTTVSTGALSDSAASLDLGALGVGQHLLTVTYLGDGLNPASSSTGVGINVTSLALTATAASSQIAYGLPIPTLSGALSGVLPQDEGGVQALFRVDAGAPLAVGNYPITASLAGSKAANYTVEMAAGSGTLEVVKAGTRVVLGQVAPAFAEIPTKLNATVAATTSGQPTGTVQFVDGTTVVASAGLSNGTAVATFTAPLPGPRDLSVEYLGDSNFLPGTSAVSAVAVSALPDFAVAPSGTQAASTAAGGVATYTLQVSALSGPFTGAVSLSAAGLPTGAAVSFSPPQVVPGAGAATVICSVQTPVTSASAAAGLNRFSEAMGALWFAGLLCRKRKKDLLCMLSATLVFVVTGCAARTVGEGTGGVLAQTYTIQVTGTATNLAGALVTHSTALTLTVQQ